MNQTRNILWPVAMLLLAGIHGLAAAGQLKVHGIFRSNMILQRDKPITIWGWAPEGKDVAVSLGKLSHQAKASGDKGRWEAVFPAQAANAAPQTIIVKAGEDVVQMDNILVGDVWVMNGQSNMAFALKGVYGL